MTTNPRPTARRRWKRLVAPLALVAFVGALYLFSQVSYTEPAVRSSGPGVSPPVVQTAAVQWRTEIVVQRPFIGRVEARQSSRVGFEAGGQIAALELEEGEAVAAGALLARLDTERLEARRDELDAAVRQSQARFDMTEITLERTRDARALNAVSSQDFDLAEKDQLASKADLERSRAALRTVEVEIEKARLTSPFDALVARRFVDRGRVVSAGEPIYLLFERIAPEVRVALATAAVDALELGDAFDVEVHGKSYRGTVARILPVRDRASRGIDVVLALEAELGLVREGDLARIRVDEKKESRGFWLPIQALTEGTRGLWAVYLIEGREGDEARLRRADVERIHQETDRVYVRGPIEEGTRVAVAGLHRLANGMTVRIAEGGSPKR